MNILLLFSECSPACVEGEECTVDAGSVPETFSCQIPARKYSSDLYLVKNID